MLIVAVPLVVLVAVAVLVLVGPETFALQAEATVNSVTGLAIAPPFARSPVPPGTRVSQDFTGTHKGIDLAVPVGTALLACGDCTVIQVDRFDRGSDGINVIVRGRGPWSQIAWSYSHMSRVDVEVGDELSPDDVVGLSGNTDGGTNTSTGPHLHFAALSAELKFIDPRPFLLFAEGGA